MQRLEVSGAVRLIYRSLGVKGLNPPPPEILDFTKIRLISVALFHVGDRTDGHDKTNGDFSKLFCERAPPPPLQKEKDFFPYPVTPDRRGESQILSLSCVDGGWRCQWFRLLRK